MPQCIEKAPNCGGAHYHRSSQLPLRRERGWMWEHVPARGFTILRAEVWGQTLDSLAGTSKAATTEWLLG